MLPHINRCESADIVCPCGNGPLTVPSGRNGFGVFVKCDKVVGRDPALT